METSIVDEIARKFGSQSALAEAIGTDQSTIAKWKGRGKDVIPARQQQKILDAARLRGIKVEPADFFRIPDCDDAEA